MNRLESVYNHEKQLGATYQYNGLGHRVGKTEGRALEPVLPTANLSQLNLNPTKQVDDVIDLTRQYHNLLARNENRDQTNFTWDFGILSAYSVDGRYYNYLLDDLGSPSRLVNDMDDIQELHGFDEFGGSISNVNKTYHQPFTYTGYQADEVSETYYAQAREYKVLEGRFISRDKIAGFVEVPFTFNSYDYCWNRALNLVDLNGLYPEDYKKFTCENGREAHILLQLQLQTHRNIQIPQLLPGMIVPELTIPEVGRADLVHVRLDFTIEVYEIKPISHANPAAETDWNRLSRTQLERYIDGLAEIVEPRSVVPGEALNGIIHERRIPSILNPGVTIVYRTFEDQPGMIFWNHEKGEPAVEPVVVLELQPERRRGFNWERAAGVGLVTVGGIGYVVSTVGGFLSFGIGFAGYKPSTAVMAAGLALLIVPPIVDTVECIQ